MHTMYRYVLNSVAKISLMFAEYFEYYGIILRGAVFSWTHCTTTTRVLEHLMTLYSVPLTSFICIFIGDMDFI